MLANTCQKLIHKENIDALTMLTSFRRFKIIKVKFILEQATKSQRGEYRYRSTVSLTSVLDGGGWSTPRSGRFIPGKKPVPIV